MLMELNKVLTLTFSHYPLFFGQMGQEIQIRTNIYNSRLLIQPNEPQISMYISSQLLGRGYFHRSSLLKRKTLALSDWADSLIPLPTLKKKVVSRASTIEDGSFLSRKQLWNTSRLLVMRWFKPLRLSLKFRLSLWYKVDGISNPMLPKN